MIPRIALLLTLLLLSTPAQALDGGIATIAAAVISAMNGAATPGSNSGDVSASDDGGD